MTHLSRDRFLRIALWPLAGVALLVLFQGAASRGSEPRESRTAQPASVSTDFAMKQLNGEPLRLSDYHGKVIMVDFWASWCPPCREEIPHFVEWQKQYGGEGLQVIGIAMDDYPADAVKAARELGINYPVVEGNDKIAGEFGGVYGLPFKLVFGRGGEIVARRRGQADLPSLKRLLVTYLSERPPARKP